MVESKFDSSPSNIYRKRLKFYSNTAQVFRLLHGIQPTRTITVKQLRLLDSSSSLDSFVNVYMTLLHDYYDAIKYDKGIEATKERLSYQKVIVVWKLLQILFFAEINKGGSYCYSTKLMTWLNYFDKRGLLQFDIQGVFNSDIPIRHTSFWPMTYKLILRGELDPLHQLFETALERASDPFEKTILKTMTNLIQSFPKWDTTNDSNNNSNGIRDDNVEQHIADERKVWRKRAAHRLRELIPFKKSWSTLIEHATVIIDMLSGNILSLCQKANSAIEAIVASVYYFNHDNSSANAPSDHRSFTPISIMTINTLAQLVIDIRKKESSITVSNEHDQHVGLLALLKGNIYQAMEECAQLDWWLLAHLSDILDRYTLYCQQNRPGDHAGSVGIFGGEPLYLHIGGRQEAAQMESRVFFLLTYANTLVVQDDMWQTAFDYMGTCGILGRTEISKTISKIPMTDSKVALEVADYCTRNGLVEQRQCIYEKTAAQLDQQQLYSAAIRYYCLAGKLERIEGVFKNIFVRYCQNRQLESFDDLDLRYKTECNGPQARFYFKFLDMQKMYKEGKLSAARKIAIDLMLSADSPDCWLPIVFLESITLMEVCQDALPGQVIAGLSQRLKSVSTMDNKEGVRLLRIYIDQVDDTGEDDSSDITTSLFDIYALVIDRLSKK